MTSPRLVRHSALPLSRSAQEGPAWGGEPLEVELLRAGVEALQQELGIGAEFGPEVLEAARAAAAAPRLPELDRTDLECVTIDPPGARDLDQALHLGRAEDGGYVVHYAIADLGAFITAGDAIDVEAHHRGQTLYGADSSIPLHPPEISAGAGSLLPGEVRPAALWTISLAPDGALRTARVERALVRSRAQLDYAQVQQVIDSSAWDSLPAGAETVRLLAEVGPLRMAQEAARGGVSLPLPEQEVVVEDGRWDLVFRSMTQVEEWNAQISLLTGIAAGTMMVEARIGILRTVPPAPPSAVDALRRTARSLGVAWPDQMAYPEFVRSLDPSEPAHAAVVLACTRLFRGSGYAAFDGELPEVVEHAAVASVYAHVTAPLRRLVDRYGTEICLALSAGEPVPPWVRTTIATLPPTMRRTGQLAGSYERGLLDLTEAVLLRDRIGEEFDAVVVDVDERRPERGEVTVAVPAVEGRVRATEPLPHGERVRVRLSEVDVEQRKIAFVVV